MAAPNDRLYDKEKHIWILRDGDEAAIGITDYAQDQLGDILYVELPDEEDEFEQDDEFCVVESGKSATGIDAPFAFTVLTVNELLDDEPEALNENPYDQFLIRVKIDDDSGLKELVEAEAYDQVAKS